MRQIIEKYQQGMLHRCTKSIGQEKGYRRALSEESRFGLKWKIKTLDLHTQRLL